MTAAALLTISILMPILVVSAVYCWRYGMLLHGNIRVTGLMAKLVALMLLTLAAACVMRWA